MTPLITFISFGSLGRSGGNSSGGARRQSDHTVPPPISRAPVISSTYQHTGQEPVVPGVYNPIRSRALLPRERQLRRESNNNTTSQGGASLPAATAGRLLNDGTISVDDVDDSGYTEAIPAGYRQLIDRMLIGGTSGRRGAARRHTHSGTDDDDEEDDDDDYDYDYDDDEEMYDSTSGESSAATTNTMPRTWWQDAVAGGNPSPAALRERAEIERQRQRHHQQFNMFVAAGGHRARPMHFNAVPDRNFFLPFHTGILSNHHLRQRHRRGRQNRNGAGINHLDFFPGEDLSDLLNFLEANAPPPPPSRPMSPTRPIKLTKLQEELTANTDYSRRVPDANFRDSAETLTAKSLEIVCTQCTGSLFDKENIWATSCGHVICNACVDAFPGASKSCGACKKRVLKKSLVH
ncbi:hypothetical protein GGI21_001346, partial [Coemansia aciculifera]